MWLFIILKIYYRLNPTITKSIDKGTMNKELWANTYCVSLHGPCCQSWLSSISIWKLETHIVKIIPSLKTPSFGETTSK